MFNSLPRSFMKTTGSLMFLKWTEPIVLWSDFSQKLELTDCSLIPIFLNNWKHQLFKESNNIEHWFYPNIRCKACDSLQLLAFGAPASPWGELFKVELKQLEYILSKCVWSTVFLFQIFDLTSFGLQASQERFRIEQWQVFKKLSKP
jgi:hypothetical protein